MDDENKEKIKTLSKAGEGFVKGTKAYNVHQGSKYTIKFNTSKSCKVDVLNVSKMGTSIKPPRSASIFHLDAPHPHRGINYNHINLNSKYSKLRKVRLNNSSGKLQNKGYDPHTPLPPGGLEYGVATAKVCQAVNNVNKVLVPIAIVCDTYRVACAGYKDYHNGTSRNVIETAASVAGGWTCGYGGAMGGAAIGTAFLPGLGTIIGGIIGGITGGITGSVASGVLVDTIGDAVEYDIEEIECESCKEKFKSRKYQGQKHCKHCLEKLN